MASSEAAAHEDYKERWKVTWRAFNRALRSPEPFDAWGWTVRLGLGCGRYMFHWSGLSSLAFRVKISHLWRPTIPLVLLGIIILVLASYYFSLRVAIVRKRWCHNDGDAACGWEVFHTLIVTYLGIMIIPNFLLAMYQSPGVALPSNNDHVIAPWRALKGQGGTFFISSTLDIAAERKRVALYGELQTSTTIETKMDAQEQDQQQQESIRTTIFPDPYPSFCKKCEIWRPPRCHHCSVCNRCVLQMDHHCTGVNNCIGYNNYKPFFFALFFLVVGCWYGVAMTIMAFHEAMMLQIKKSGLKFLYGNRTGFLDLPMPWKIIYQSFTGKGFDPEACIKMVFFLLLMVGIVLTAFFLSHWGYVCTAETSLETSIRLSMTRDQILRAIHSNQPRHAGRIRFINMFNQGRTNNIRQMLGPNVWKNFVPFFYGLSPPLPYLPKQTNGQNA